MPRYDVYRNPSQKSRAAMPFLLDVQADLLEGLGTRVVVPLGLPRPVPLAPRTLQPRLRVEGVELVMLTPLVAAVARSSLGEKVGNVGAEGASILAALDMLLTGS